MVEKYVKYFRKNWIEMVIYEERDFSTVLEELITVEREIDNLKREYIVLKETRNDLMQELQKTVCDNKTSNISNTKKEKKTPPAVDERIKGRLKQVKKR